MTSPAHQSRSAPRFGPAVADLLTGLARLEATSDVESSSDEVLQLKLADRLHNMRTIQYVHPDSQRFTSAQTLQTLVPIAARLHLTDAGLELSSLASAVLHSPAPRTARTPTDHLAALLLPRTTRSRWLTEWAGELAMVPTTPSRHRPKGTGPQPTCTSMQE